MQKGPCYLVLMSYLFALFLEGVGVIYFIIYFNSSLQLLYTLSKTMINSE